MTSGAFALSLVLFGVFGVVAGKLNDRFGPRVLLTVCGLFLGSGFALVSQIDALWQLYLIYGIVIAIGVSGSFVPLASTIARWFVKRRGIMTGVAVSGVGVGTLVMPPVVNWLIASYGWRSAYIVVGVVTLVVVTLAAQFLKYDPKQVGQSPYGGSQQTRQLWMLIAAWFCFGLSQGTVLVHIVSHTIELGLTAASGALVLSVVGGTSAVGRIAIGAVSDRIGNRTTLLMSFSLLSGSLFWLLLADTPWMFYLFAVLFGFSYSGISILASPVAAEHFGLGSHGVLLGCIMFGVETGKAVGPVMAGHIFDVSGSYSLAFIIYTATSVTGLLLIMLLKSTKREGSNDEPRRSA
jgi:MFS family permease